MIVVLDSTELYGNWYLRGQSFETFKRFLDRHVILVNIPQLVVDETVASFRDCLTKTLDELRKGAAAFQVEGLAVPTIDIPQATQDYRTALEKRLSNLGIWVKNWKEHSVEPLVRRALSRRKPFDADGRSGFRDAIIWETILEMLGGGERIVFITRNKKDFGEHACLEQDLRDDLKHKGLPENAVEICQGLSKFVEDYVLPQLKNLDEIKQKIQDAEFRAFNIRDFYRKNRQDILDKQAFMIRLYTTDFENAHHGQPFIRPDIRAGTNVVRLGNEQYEDICIFAVFTTHGSIKWPGAFRPGPTPWSIIDDCEVEADLELSMSLVIDFQTGELKEWNLFEVIPKWQGNH